jgi:hypothetical protein
MKWPVIFAAATAFFWGCYGPVLGQARSGLQSPFKPYLMIGIAYLIIGIGGGLAGMWYKGDSFALESFMSVGTAYGLFAGALGAAGAFTLTLAMFSGGTAMPHIIMPIVFGGAVTVTGFYSAIQEKTFSGGLLIGMVIVLVGIILVTVNTPQAHPPQKAPPAQPSSQS